MFKIKELFSSLKNEFQFFGDDNIIIKNIISFSDAINNCNSESLSWVNDKNAIAFNGNITLGLLIISKSSFPIFKDQQCNFLVTDEPRKLFQEVLKLKFSSRYNPCIEKSAFIHPKAQIGNECYIGHNVVIEADCIIGNNCEILHNTAILKNTIIGNNVRIGSNCGIGNFGFGYEKNNEGEYDLLEHTGNVIIEDDVHIHNNTCIDRAVIGSTIIRANVKIDNLVHIAHGVIIERNALIIANAMIAGSTIIGEGSWIAPSTSVKNQLKIGANTTTGIGAVILKDTETNSLMIGNPATTMEEYKVWSSIKKSLMKPSKD
jgi:UDP-3-O-[3-hydroxymyristoyl] glucosamine N-acyltransferase